MLVCSRWFFFRGVTVTPLPLSLSLSSPLSLSDSGVGAGIDSYYEYCLKYYILLGDTEYLHRFNKVCMTTFSHGRNVCEISWIRETKTIRVFVKFGNVCKSVIAPIVSKGTCSFSSLSLRPPTYFISQHYTAIKKYISNGPLLVDVNMAAPNKMSRSFMDSLLAFWPGLQVWPYGVMTV